LAAWGGCPNDGTLAIREQLNMQPGSEVEFVVEGNTLTVIPVTGENIRGQCIVERLRGKGSICMTTDEIMALTRGEG